PVSSTLVAMPSALKKSMVSWTPKAANEECRNRPPGPNASTMPRLSVAWVMLQRVPPDMRILTPGLRFFSSSRVRRPRSAAWLAASSPAAPAPITTTSHCAASIARLRCFAHRCVQVLMNAPASELDQLGVVPFVFEGFTNPAFNLCHITPGQETDRCHQGLSFRAGAAQPLIALHQPLVDIMELVR